MSQFARLLVVSIVACGTTHPHDLEPVIFEDRAFVDDSLSAGDQTWFLVGPESRDERRPRTICRLIAHDLLCAKVPASEAGARLVEPGLGASPLLALAMGGDTLYVEPFTWKAIRRLEGVSVDQHAVVLRDGTMWIEQPHNLLVVPPGGDPRRWFSADVSTLYLSPLGVFWVDYRGRDPATQTPVVYSAVIDGDRLAKRRERSGVGMWMLGRGGVCQAGTTVGLIELQTEDLVYFDLDTDGISRIHVGDRMYVHCGHGTVAAAPLIWSSSFGPLVSWCDRTGCRAHATRLPIPYVSGAYTVIDHHVFAVGTTLEDMLVTWKIGEPPRLVALPRKHEYNFEQAISLPDGGAMAVSIHGPLFVFDRDGSIRRIKLRWSGSPFAPCWNRC